MKTLQEIKEEVTNELKHCEWFLVCEIGGSDFLSDEVARRYATECVKASQELIAENANVLLSYEEDGIKHSISIHETNFDSTKNRKHVCVDKQSITSEENIILL